MAGPVRRRGFAAAPMGMMIVLNGTSSSGKTSLARVLQNASEEPLLYLSLDAAIAMVPAAYSGAGEQSELGYALRSTVETTGGAPLVCYRPGPLARRLNRHLATFAASLVADGLNVVLDHVINDPDTMQDLATALARTTAYLIGVTCPSAEADAREQARSDRLLGLARSQRGQVHSGGWTYDLVVDSGAASPDVLARLVLDRLAAGPPLALNDFAAR